MTVKELKEKLEILIEEGKGDYTIFDGSYYNIVTVDVNDEYKEVYV